MKGPRWVNSQGVGAACCREGRVLGVGVEGGRGPFGTYPPARVFFQFLCFGPPSPTPLSHPSWSDHCVGASVAGGADLRPVGGTQRGPEVLAVLPAQQLLAEGPGSRTLHLGLGLSVGWALGLAQTVGEHLVLAGVGGWCHHIPLLTWEPLPRPQPWVGGRHPEQYTPHGGGSHKAVILLFPSAMLKAPDPLQNSVSKKEEGRWQRQPLFSMPPTLHPAHSQCLLTGEARAPRVRAGHPGRLPGQGQGRLPAQPRVRARRLGPSKALLLQTANGSGA